MTSVEHDRAASHPVRDPTDAIFDFATTIGAASIAADARRMSTRLDGLRLFVAVIGYPHTLRAITRRMFGTIPVPHDARAVIRFGRHANARATYRDGTEGVIPQPPTGHLAVDVSTIEWFVEAPLLRHGICITLDSPTAPRHDRRIDLIVTGKTELAEISQCWPHLKMLIVDTERDEDIDAAIGCIDGLATESGAACVEDRVELHHRQLCTRLGNHLAEQQRALVRSPSAMLARINALTIVRVLTESAIETRAHRPDSERQMLARWLSTERTKFLMASKADALAALDERVSQSNHPRHRLRATATDASHAIAMELLLQLWRRVSAEVDKAIATLSQSLLAELDGSLADLGDSLPPQALAGFDVVPIRGWRSDLEWSTSSGYVSKITDRLGLASRRRIMNAARDELVEMLSNGSRRVIELALLDHDETCSVVERRFCELLDSAIESAQIAMEVALDARVGAPDRVAQVRNRISRWSSDLEALAARLE